MAIDVYLQIDGIKGESQDSTHLGWIELLSAQLGVLQPKSATASTAGATLPNAANTAALR
jgi:type VI secretion system secreted protein Hcp